jgi:hypothetical protein
MTGHRDSLCERFKCIASASRQRQLRAERSKLKREFFADSGRSSGDQN